jgi:CSLREA domain-containing protein
MSFTQRVLPARRGWTLEGRGLRLIIIGFAVPLFTVMTCAMTQGATFTVNSTGDGTDTQPGDGICETAPGNAICTLRAAILEANAAAGPDVIVFDAGLVSQMLTLTGGRLDIRDDLTIGGPGAARLRVNGSGRDIFRIPDSRIAVALNGLTLENGGEAIEITGSRNILTVADAALIGTGNDDGIRINGDFNWVSIVDVVLRGHEDNLQVGSSGVCSATTELTCFVNAGCPIGETCMDVLGHNNTIDVVDSMIRLASQDGVAINGSDNTVTVQDSTISENGLHPTDPNDGLDVNGAGNAVWILQVTVSGNGEHGVDIEGPDNQVTLENSTLTNNDSDGVIIQDHINRANTRSTVFVQNNIIAGNRGARSSATVGGADVFDAYESNNFISGGYNLVGNATGSPGFDGSGDQAGTATNLIGAPRPPRV